MTLLAKTKERLRITSNDFDDEILDLISEAKADLQSVGISTTLIDSDDNPAILGAIFLFCKARFGWDNPDADRLMHCYLLKKENMMHQEEYMGS